ALAHDLRDRARELTAVASVPPETRRKGRAGGHGRRRRLDVHRDAEAALEDLDRRVAAPRELRRGLGFLGTDAGRKRDRSQAEGERTATEHPPHGYHDSEKNRIPTRQKGAIGGVSTGVLRGMVDETRNFVHSARSRLVLRAAIVLLLSMVVAVPASAKDRDTRTHTVAPGQLLGTIARRYGISVQALCGANGLNETDIIRPGQRLIIPPP